MEVTDLATLFGILLALAILAMSVGLIRRETASDLRTLAATGASGTTRRTITAVTTGALGFLGALLGMLGGYVGMIGWIRSNSINGGISALGNVPWRICWSFLSRCHSLLQWWLGYWWDANRPPSPISRSSELADRIERPVNPVLCNARLELTRSSGHGFLCNSCFLEA
jgi:putative ABC transport system permease protein